MNEIQEYQEGLLWKSEGDGSHLFGFTQSALDLSGSVISVDLADEGDEFKAGDWMGEVQGQNSTVEIVAPFDLKVIERNEDVMEQPALLEDDPTGDAWVIRAERQG